MRRPRATLPLLPAMYNLSQLDVERYDVFAVCSKLFWRTKVDLVQMFFQHLTEVGSSGFLAASDVSVCEAAAAKLGVRCIVSRRYPRDNALSKERWHIALEILRRGHSIAYAGLDVRFLRPVRGWLTIASADQVDAAFEGGFDIADRKLGDFTPDFALLHPTRRAISFLERLTVTLLGRSLEGLPAFLQEPSLLRFNLMGPAEQDLLKDALLSTLHNRTVVVRKYMLARQAALSYKPGARLAGQTVGDKHAMGALPHCGGGRRAAQRPEWRAACRGGGVVLESDLPPLPFTWLPHGVRVESPLLRVFLTNGVGLRVGLLPCQACQGWTPSRTLGFHCLTKLPECLNLTRCACLHQPAPPRRRSGGGTSRARAPSQAGAGAYHAAAALNRPHRRAQHAAPRAGEG